MQRRAGFTLIEIAIAVFILMLLLLLAIPSVTGVLANRRLQSSLNAMNRIVRLAQEHSVQEHRPKADPHYPAGIDRGTRTGLTDGDTRPRQRAGLRAAVAGDAGEESARPMDLLALRRL